MILSCPHVRNHCFLYGWIQYPLPHKQNMSCVAATDSSAGWFCACGQGDAVNRNFGAIRNFSGRFPYFVILTVFFCPFFLKSFLYFFNFDEGTLIFAFLWIPFSALLPTLVIFLLLIVILFSFLQL